MISIVSSLF